MCGETLLDKTKKEEYLDNLMARPDIIDDPDDEDYPQVEQLRPETKKGKVYKGRKNRPPFVQDDPSTTDHPRPFTIKDLKHKFSAGWEYVYKARAKRYARHVEDQIQFLTDPLPFGVRLHRVVGKGARTSKWDGLPGFLVKTGIAYYKITQLVWDDKGKLVSLCGVGRDGKLTKAWIWH